MNKTPRLMQRLAITTLTLLLSGGTMSLWAQQEQKEAIDAAAPEEKETQDAGETPASTPEETDAGPSPFDYQSAEKISEDLSVSFPVDI